VQNDKYLEVMEYEIPISLALSDQIIQDSVNNIEHWQKECKNIISKMKARETIIHKSAVTSIRPHVETRVSASVSDLISSGNDAWERASREYTPMMAAIAKSLSPGFTSNAVQKRIQIASVLPDMRTQTNATKKSHKKGGGR